MALTLRRGDQSGCRDESWIGRSGAAKEPALTGGRRYIVAFAEIFNRLLPRRAAGQAERLKRA